MRKPTKYTVPVKGKPSLLLFLRETGMFLLFICNKLGDFNSMKVSFDHTCADVGRLNALQTVIE